jgi:hypothetical protein
LEEKKHNSNYELATDIQAQTSFSEARLINSILYHQNQTTNTPSNIDQNEKKKTEIKIELTFQPGISMFKAL